MGGEKHIPAQCWPVGYYIQEELDARGWTSTDLADRMGATTQKDRDIWELTVDLLIHCSDDRIMIGQSTADALARAFGTSPEFYINLNDAYQQWRKRVAPTEKGEG